MGRFGVVTFDYGCINGDIVGNFANNYEDLAIHMGIISGDNMAV